MAQDWVFWFNVQIRKDWFSFWWKTRGSNFMEIQVWIFKISIGLPWSKIVKEYYLKQDGNLNKLDKVNIDNLKGPWTLLIKQITWHNKRQ